MSSSSFCAALRASRAAMMAVERVGKGQSVKWWAGRGEGWSVPLDSVMGVSGFAARRPFSTSILRRSVSFSWIQGLIFSGR